MTASFEVALVFITQLVGLESHWDQHPHLSFSCGIDVIEAALCAMLDFLYTARSTSGMRSHSAGQTENGTSQPVCLTWGKSKEGGFEKTLSVTCKEGAPAPQLVQLGDQALTVYVLGCCIPLGPSWLVPVVGPQAKVYHKSILKGTSQAP